MAWRVEHRTEERDDDTTLLAQLRSGDESAVVALVERYHNALTRLARAYVTDAAAEDVAQETWLAVIRGLDSFEGRASFKTWLFRILANRARTRATRDARTVSFSSLVHTEVGGSDPAVDPERFRGPDDERWPGHWLLPPRGALPEEELLSAELHAHVRAAIDNLPPAQREVVKLRDLNGLSAAEVCQLLEITDANQRVLLHRGRSKVRGALEQYISARAISH